MFSYVDLEERVAPTLTLRKVRAIVNAALAALDAELARLYSAEGRPSIPPERQLMDQMHYNLLFRRFVGLGIDDPVWVPTVFSKNRDRLLNADIARRLLAAILAHKEVMPLLSDDHFSVDGTLVEAWASMKSFQPKATETGAEPPADDSGSGQDGQSTVEMEDYASAASVEPAVAADPSDKDRFRTADELCAVARDIGADAGEMRLGARATEREVKAMSESGKLAQYRVVHFATHGAMAGELKGAVDPGLILTPPDTANEEDDGYLSASEIAALKLDADWVILSACTTAAGNAVNAEAALGPRPRLHLCAGPCAARVALGRRFQCHGETHHLGHARNCARPERRPGGGIAPRDACPDRQRRPA